MTAEPLAVAGRGRGNRLSGLSIRRENQAYAALFLVPTAVLFIALVGYPILYSLLLTVTGRGTAPGRLGPFVGLANWQRIATDPIFSQAAVQTLMYVIPSAILGVVLGMATALVLNERFRLRGLARAALLIPWALPPVVVAAMFQWFLDSRRGLLGEWLVNAGLVDQPPLFLSGVPGTLFMLTAIHLWKTFPLITLIFLVALQYLPEETMNAARIDGASRWRRFRHVVLPYLRPSLVAAVIIQVLVTIQLFDLIFALTGGGPGRYSTYNLYFYTFKTTFEQTDFGYGAVLAYVVTAFVVVLALLLTRGRARSLLS
jgi:multiple sugar transport system permease protein